MLNDMKKGLSLYSLALLVMVLLLSGCYHQQPKHNEGTADLTEEQLDSLSFSASHHYSNNYNFVVKADSLPLIRQQPEELVTDVALDTLYVKRHDHVAVAGIRTRACCTSGPTRTTSRSAPPWNAPTSVRWPRGASPNCPAVSGSASPSGGTQTITDMGGTQVEVPMNPTAYADAWYAHNEVTIMLTGAKGLVATHCDPKKFPWMYKVCPNMSKATSTFGDDFNFEDLSTLNPQVIFDSKETLRDKAKEVGIPVVNCMFQTYEDMKKSITMTAQVFGGDAPKIAEK